MRTKLTRFSLTALMFFLIFSLGGCSTKIGPSLKRKNESQKNRMPGKKSQSPGERKVTSGTKEEVKTYRNSRFNFSFDYPKSWEATESQNGDGVILTNPAEKSVFARVYGFHNVMSNPLSKVVSNREEWQKSTYPDFIVSDKRQIKVGEQQAIEAVWSYTVQSNDLLQGRLAGKIVFLLKDEVGYGIELMATETAYGKLEDKFSELLESFELK